jgi:cytochrome c-type biogenesis protein CcmH/NrfG
MLLGLVILIQLPLPFRLSAYALALPLAWIGVHLLIAMRDAQNAGARVRGRLTVVIGLALTGFVLLSLIADTVYYPLSSGLEQCLADADAETARDACHEEQERQIEELNQRLRRRAGLP